jgi:hypoxanthine phosphoribosyltransferase
MKKVFLSEEKFRNCLVNIFMQMYHDSFKPDLIVGLARGGLAPGVYLSHMLDVPFKALNKYELFYNSIESPNVLVIDDINDTGATLKDFSNRYTDLFDMVRYAVIVNNESSSFDADYYGMSYNKLDEPDWWVFPWEKWWINN